MNRLKAIKNIRNNLIRGECSIGSWMQIPNSSVAEIMGQAGYDWIAVDIEHGAISVHQLPDLFRALELGGTLPLARVAQGKEKDCKQALDAGAGGLIVPMVKNSLQLEEISGFMRWPPSGKRGVAFSRANMFGKNFSEYRKEAQQPLLIAMIEHINAIEDLDSILQIKELDAILIGPYDLSASMGITAEFDNKDFIKVIHDIKEKSTKAKISCGIHVVEPSLNELIKRIDENYSFIAYAMDSVFLSEFSILPKIK